MKVTIEGNSEEIKKLFNTSASSIEQKNMELKEINSSDELGRIRVTDLSNFERNI